MSQTPDKRRRTDLDLFVLALIDGGIATPYELKKAAGLSPGATIPTLARLLEAGLVRPGKPTARGRTDHRVTPAGKKLLKTGWRALIEDGPSGDLDADLRVALLAIWAGGQSRLAAEFLQQSAAKKFELVAALEERVETGSGFLLADWYTRLRSESGRAILKAESAAAFAMAETLPRKLSAKPTRRKRSAKSQK